MDVPDAYVKGKRMQRMKTHMATPVELDIHGPNGEKMCIEFGGTPTWGEAPAGREWQFELEEALLSFGWRPAEDVPCLFYKETSDARAEVSTHVDDMYVTESRSSRRKLMRQLRDDLAKRYGGVTYKEDPTEHVGYTIRKTRGERGTRITLTMEKQIETAAREHVPEIVAGKSVKEAGLIEGTKLRNMAEAMVLEPREPGAKLQPKQTETQSIIGSLKYVERIHIENALVDHKLSCVMSNPGCDAHMVAKSVLAATYKNRYCGITYGGANFESRPETAYVMHADFKMDDGAPRVSELTADATWSDTSLIGILITKAGAVVHHQV